MSYQWIYYQKWKQVRDARVSLIGNKLKFLTITEDNIEIKNCSNNLETKINDIIVIVNELLPKIHDIDKKEIGDLVDQEMHNTTQAIEEAVAKLEVLLEERLKGKKIIKNY